MKSERWIEARAHLSDALLVKPHYAEANYCCGVCALKLKDNASAMTDFRRVVGLDPTHYQAWSNLGVLFSQDKQLKEALFAFREACRLRGDSWQLWQQQAVVAVELGRFDQALFASLRGMQTGGEPQGPVCSLVAQAVAKDVRGAEGSSARRLLPRLRELLDLNCARQPSELRHWEVRIYVERECGTRDEVGGVLKAEVRALRETTEWTTDAPTLEAFSEVVAQLVEHHMQGGDADQIRAVAALVEDVLHLATEKLAASPGCEALRMLQTSLRRHMDDD
jgi:hypothetical protein